MPQTKLTIGNVEILALHDHEAAMPLEALFPAVPAGDWEPYLRRYPEGFVGGDSLRLHFECYLIRSGGRTILVDTGIGGNASNPGTVGAFVNGVDGKLLSELQSAGVSPEDVDTVFHTHLHPDHVGWNLTHSGGTARPTFPNARYVAHQADWDSFRNPEIQQAFPFSFWEETLGPLEALGLTEGIQDGHNLTDEITAISTPGHTPGSMSLPIVSGGQHALLVGDLIHGPTQITETEWALSFDMDPATASQSRRAMLDRAEREDAILGICHHSGFGRVVLAEGRRYWQGL
jgi:glyoxylase-like metal-dependent hydrolase (beta-lactamase superfamily II)